MAAGSLYDGAYGVAIIEEIKKQTGRELNISAAHAVLRRLEEKDLSSSRMGALPTNVVEDEKGYSL